MKTDRTSIQMQLLTDIAI